jgi:hypothetical protein
MHFLRFLFTWQDKEFLPAKLFEPLNFHTQRQLAYWTLVVPKKPAFYSPYSSHEIAGRADDEEVPDVLIENDFGRGARISASDNRLTRGKAFHFASDRAGSIKLFASLSTSWV